MNHNRMRGYADGLAGNAQANKSDPDYMAGWVAGINWRKWCQLFDPKLRLIHLQNPAS